MSVRLLRRWPFALPLMTAVLWVVSATARAQSAAQQPTFSTRSDLVVLRVAVLDRKHRPVEGLGRDAFAVSENGIPHPIAFFSNEDTPVTAGLVIDSSGSMLPKRPAVIAGALAFAASSHKGDELFVVSFNEHPRLALPPDKPFTSQAFVLNDALLSIGARGRTALFDAVLLALDHVEKGHSDQKALIVISDGGDNASRTPFDRVLERAERADTVIYTIGVFADEDRDADPGTLKKLARATGGTASFPRQPSEVPGVLERIAREIRGTYLIGYASDSAQSGYRKVSVALQSPDRRRLIVRHRPGYLAGTGVVTAGHPQ